MIWGMGGCMQVWVGGEIMFIMINMLVAICNSLHVYFSMYVYVCACVYECWGIPYTVAISHLLPRAAGGPNQ